MNIAVISCICCCFCSEWTGDLQKLPNIKLRKVSNKGLDVKNEGEEINEAEEDDQEDELDEDQLDENLLMSDS